MSKSALIKLLFMVLFFLSKLCFAQDAWDFKLIYETSKLVDSPFFLMTTADLNQNGVKELIVADFGKFGDHIDEWKEWRKDWNHYNLFVLEWDKGELKATWKKQWDMTMMKTDMDAHRYFLAFEARQMVTWQLGNKVMVETIPPYLGLEWGKDKYILHEQQGPFNEEPLVGSWVFPWLSPSCYQSFSPNITWPRECLVGIRSFLKGENLKILTIVEEKNSDKQYKQTFHIRKFEPGFEIEWKKLSPKRFGWWTPGWEVFVDRLNFNSISWLLLIEFKTATWYLFDKETKDYSLKSVHGALLQGIDPFDLPDVYLRTTQQKDMEEYWGYHPKKGYDGKPIQMLKVGLIKPDLNYVERDVDFSRHKSFLGIGFFDLKDLDGDGLDEVILVEETGKREFGEETVYYSDIKDYIRILKWDGKEYKTMWVSPPYTKRGTKFLVEDVKNTGKKQLVVMTSYGTIQIWERQ